MSFFNRTAQGDQSVFAAIAKELARQQDNIELIASENIVSPAVLAAQGSVLTNKYAEGYPGKRYYGGCEFFDEIESLAIERAKALFGSNYANVQPHSGAQANLSVLFALLQPGDAILGMGLAHGGHLTHGAAPTISGRWFRALGYGVRPDDQRIDFDEVESLAREHRPKLIIAGGSAYSRMIDFPRFRAIADAVGAYLMVDMAHIAGLVAAGEHPSPVGHAHVITSTTHKTLRGPDIEEQAIFGARLGVLPDRIAVVVLQAGGAELDRAAYAGPGGRRRRSKKASGAFDAAAIWDAFEGRHAT